MPLEIHQESGCPITLVQARGTLEKADYEEFASQFEKLYISHGKLRVLFDMTAFDGWTAGALWNEIKFDAKHLDEIERLAGIGARKWKEGMLVFAKPFTKAAIRYFDSSEVEQARQWLAQS